MSLVLEVTAIDTDRVDINNKTVRRDMEGNWLAVEELTPSELAAFNSWLERTGQRDN